MVETVLLRGTMDIKVVVTLNPFLAITIMRESALAIVIYYLRSTPDVDLLGFLLISFCQEYKGLFSFLIIKRREVAGSFIY